ncbi:N-acetylmuramoyl-L-alanine amidase [Nakamurella sp. YIM 132087]|uniref:N-acetylmuramoyl-L-alanine amidase n=1 Tax=Nakamurella alba TaxID=2665158 RepID=A0A7K1FPK8_9ACTN|nr:N-acetylmuramoyl-L-alanine amidase [Nakamurella alba]MTD15289.1 N-acetylmuramoyl-L-alanine amidase [Nakamurella alba]
MLRRGDHGPSVAGLRSALASLGLLPAQVPAPATNGHARQDEPVFDNETDAAVRAFQQQRGLNADGIVGPATTRALTDARWSLGDRTLTYTLSAMMSGDDVYALQVRLAEFGYNTGRPDGRFGPLTDACVRNFQRDRGLPEDGVFGAATFRELTRMRPMVTGGRPHYLREHHNLRQSGPRLRGKRIVIDPAHGGSDPGWVVDTDDGEVRAADLTYDIARRLEGRMVATGMDTFVTRGPGQNPTSEERAALANEVDADLLISLHIDGSTSAQASGLATFHFGSDSGATSTVGETLAELVQKELVARTQLTDCRVHHRTWELLRLTRMPAIQIELGYLSHPIERARLLRDDFRNTLADGILVAVKRLYLDGRDDPHTGTFTFSELLAHEESVRGA